MGFGFIDDSMNFISRLMNSLDHCIDRFIIVGSKYHEHRFLSQPKLHDNLTYLPQPHHLIGVSEGWNLIIQSSPTAPWFLITAYDVEFLPGQLEQLSKRFWRESRVFSDPPDNENGEILTNFAHTKWQNLPGGKGFNLFAISREVIENCGYFDENIFPAFWEDRDYQYRMKLWRGSRIRTYRMIRPWHGEHPPLSPQQSLASSSTSPSPQQQPPSFNYTSGTVYLRKEWSQIMALSSQWNLRYVTKKWGCDLTSALEHHHLLNCSYVTPFDKPDLPISAWTLNRERVQRMKRRYDRLLSGTLPDKDEE
jgi:hypothetical protein